MFNIHFNIEKWKYNKEYEVYVSNYGRIKDKNKQILYPKALHGYLYIFYKQNMISVHRLVLGTFCPPAQEGLTVDHIDHNTRNNNLSNLRWLTFKDNSSEGKEAIECLKNIGAFEYSQGLRKIPSFSQKKKNKFIKRAKKIKEKKIEEEKVEEEKVEEEKVEGKEAKAKNYLFKLCYCMKRENTVIVNKDVAAYIIYIKNGSPLKQVKDFLENLIINETEKAYKFGFDINVVKEF